ncbi:hypothetical protein LguiA_030672 [Lonicera macranthoides]
MSINHNSKTKSEIQRTRILSGTDYLPPIQQNPSSSSPIASKHPFVTGEPFTCSYIPAPETLRMPVCQNAKVDHQPAGGHWFAAGLSPNVDPLVGVRRFCRTSNVPMQRWVCPPQYKAFTFCASFPTKFSKQFGAAAASRGSIMRGQQLFGEVNGITLWSTSSSPLFPALTPGGWGCHVLQEAMACHRGAQNISTKNSSVASGG